MRHYTDIKILNLVLKYMEKIAHFLQKKPGMQFGLF